MFTFSHQYPENLENLENLFQTTISFSSASLTTSIFVSVLMCLYLYPVLSWGMSQIRLGHLGHSMGHSMEQQCWTVSKCLEHQKCTTLLISVVNLMMMAKRTKASTRYSMGKSCLIQMVSKVYSLLNFYNVQYQTYSYWSLFPCSKQNNKSCYTVVFIIFGYTLKHPKHLEKNRNK